MATTVRRTRVTLPAAPIGPENPLPALLAPRETHDIPAAERAVLPPDVARQAAYRPLTSLLPVRSLDGYGRDRASTALDAIAVEGDRLRAIVLPGLGGRVWSLVHKPTGRELLYRNPVLQPANFGLAGAWFSGGIEWNVGATGHTPLACAPLHAARVPAPDGGEMLRLWEWERLSDVPFQVDLWIPEGSDFLHVGVRLRNVRHHAVPVYWWSNTAVPEGDRVRVLAPAERAWHFGYARTPRSVPVPVWKGADRTYGHGSRHAADYFYDVPDAERRWIAALDADGRGLAQTSTDVLRGRKLFVWGHGRGGRRWQRWLTEPGTGGYVEVQAGLARTQLEHVPLPAGAEFRWLEAYGPLSADPGAVHGADWAGARGAVAEALEASLPREAVEEAERAWLAHADASPGERLASGSGWGALEALHGGHDLPGTPYDPDTLGAAQEPWAVLARTGHLPESDRMTAPGATPVGPHWRDLLEAAAPGPLTEYHLGVVQWHAGDRAQAVRSWERSLRHAETWWTLRCLAVADAEAGHAARAADRWLEAFRLAAGEAEGGAPEADVRIADVRTADAEPARADPAGTKSADADPADADVRFANVPFATPDPATPDPADPPHSDPLPALAREVVPALLARGRAAEAGSVLERLPEGVRGAGRFRLLAARVRLAEGDAVGARAVFDAGFEVADLREGDETLEETWYAVAERLLAGAGPVTDAVRARARAEQPLPEAYDFRMRPADPPAPRAAHPAEAPATHPADLTDPTADRTATPADLADPTPDLATALAPSENPRSLATPVDGAST